MDHQLSEIDPAIRLTALLPKHKVLLMWCDNSTSDLPNTAQQTCWCLMSCRNLCTREWFWNG